MKTLLLLLFISLSAFANIELGLDVGSNEVNQGALLKASLFLRPSEAGKFSATSLKGKQIAKTLYFHQISPFMGKEGQGFYTADATVVFVKVPNGQSISETIDGETITVVWKDLRVLPTDGKDFKFSDFEIPSRVNYIIYLIFVVALLAIAYFALVLQKKHTAKQKAKARKQQLKDQLVSCTNYENVVELWKSRRMLIEEFPVIEKNFDKLEGVLFKHQFKRERSEKDIEEVMVAYQTFRTETEGDLIGI